LDQQEGKREEREREEKKGDMRTENFFKEK